MTTSDHRPRDAEHGWIRPSGLEGDEARWGHPGGLQIGLQPGFGPRGLVRVFAPYLGLERDRLLNFVAFEPVVVGSTKRGLSELEHSSLDDVRGKRFWSSDALEHADPDSAAPARGVVEMVDGVERLTVWIHSEPFDNGAIVSVRARFRADRPREVALAAHTREGSAPLTACILTATMGNLPRLRRLHLRDRAETSGALWPDFEGDHFAEHARFGLDDMIELDDGYQVVAVPDELVAQDAVYADDTKEHWKYPGRRGAQGWRVHDPDPAIEVLVNGRAAYWASSSPIPGGISFENFELVQPFREGQEATFWVEPLEDDADLARVLGSGAGAGGA